MGDVIMKAVLEEYARAEGMPVASCCFHLRKSALRRDGACRIRKPCYYHCSAHHGVIYSSKTACVSGAATCSVSLDSVWLVPVKAEELSGSGALLPLRRGLDSGAGR